MEIRVLGCNGSQLPGYRLTGFLIDADTLLDAGAVTSVLTLEEQTRVRHILITHAHLDHIREIASLADNLCHCRMDTPVEVVSTPLILETVHRHIFNDQIWPDFSRIPSVERPVLRFVPLREGEKRSCGHLNVTAIPVHHAVESVAYVIESGQDGGLPPVVFVGDTGPTEEIWQVVRQGGAAGAVFLETSLPEELTEVAELTGHLTPTSLAGELKKLGSHHPQIYLHHMKLPYSEEIRREIALLGNPLIHVLQDGQVIRI